jgi:hypothetical protein
MLAASVPGPSSSTFAGCQLFRAKLWISTFSTSGNWNAVSM